MTTPLRQKMMEDLQLHGYPGGRRNSTCWRCSEPRKNSCSSNWRTCHLYPSIFIPSRVGTLATTSSTKQVSVPIRLGLRANWQQFALLVLINAFVGAIVGMELTIMPLIAEDEFNLASRTVTLSFLVSFGIVKAVSNLFAGRLSEQVGRKRILVAGWLVWPSRFC